MRSRENLNANKMQEPSTNNQVANSPVVNNAGINAPNASPNNTPQANNIAPAPNEIDLKKRFKYLLVVLVFLGCLYSMAWFYMANIISKDLHQKISAYYNSYATNYSVGEIKTIGFPFNIGVQIDQATITNSNQFIPLTVKMPETNFICGLFTNDCSVSVMPNSSIQYLDSTTKMPNFDIFMKNGFLLNVHTKQNYVFATLLGEQISFDTFIDSFAFSANDTFLRIISASDSKAVNLVEFPLLNLKADSHPSHVAGRNNSNIAYNLEVKSLTKVNNLIEVGDKLTLLCDVSLYNYMSEGKKDINIMIRNFEVGVDDFKLNARGFTNLQFECYDPVEFDLKINIQGYQNIMNKLLNYLYGQNSSLMNSKKAMITDILKAITGQSNVTNQLNFKVETYTAYKSDAISSAFDRSTRIGKVWDKDLENMIMGLIMLNPPISTPTNSAPAPQTSNAAPAPQTSNAAPAPQTSNTVPAPQISVNSGVKTE
jgi:hypothetical protein